MIDDIVIDRLVQPAADWWSNLTGTNNYRLASKIMLAASATWCAAAISA